MQELLKERSATCVIIEGRRGAEEHFDQMCVCKYHQAVAAFSQLRTRCLTGVLFQTSELHHDAHDT